MVALVVFSLAVGTVLEAAMGPAPTETQGARERLCERLEALAARMRATRGDGPLTPEEEAGASIATLVAWSPGISEAAAARVKAFFAGRYEDGA